MPRKISHVTLKDVADAAGTSISTVSLALRGKDGIGDETRERVRAIAEELGYRPDQSASLLRSRHSKLIGVVFDIHQVFHSLLIEGIYEQARSLGYSITLSAITRTRSETEAIRAVQSERAEGVIILGSSFSAREFDALRVPIPTVSIGPRIGQNVAVVYTDHTLGAKLVARHLNELGHRRIGVISVAGMPTGNARGRAHVKAIREIVGLPPVVAVASSDEPEDGVEAVRELVAVEGLTAIVCHNDLVAIGALQQLRAQGIRVPDEISVVGFDDNALSRLPNIDLTTVRQDTHELARLATERVVSEIEGTKGPGKRQVLPPELIVRKTTSSVCRE